ncbi:basic amino acid ABC transporter substrate-binding protein [Desulfuribacillus alkaliarsenatis]|uniref:Solute-binding protein family 3/N-terminal domain-containing protein n=1 Tax=Desulfuribacillus alkaliarsenatis TaxID=766136 RepID=A0A1E5G3Y2_9FIRM|nr:basic amino acid ABC transporter substrate-binding protein [Desulfuribacillus alkaliarsenatis]OEF97797.1 hypothetical protein BHF68_13240 [Desulfuribacillus alkaliarsenatis]
MKKWTKLFLVFTLALSVALLAACGSSDTQAPANDDAADPSLPVYKVGTDAAYKPFEWTMPNGDIVGFDVDVINAVGEAAGFRVDIQHKGWEGLFETVENGEVDMAVSAITITEERKQKYDFANPYFEATQLILVPENSDINSLADLEGKDIGVQQGTTGDIAVRSAFGQQYSGVKPFENTPFAIQALSIGQVDAVVADNVVVMEYVKANPNANLRYVFDDAFDAEYYGFLVKKGNTELLEKLNEGLRIIKENGTYDAIYAEYFGQ